MPDAPERRPRLSPSTRRILKIHAVIAFVVVVVAILPAIGALIASAVASANGCVMNEAGAHPCAVLGVDVGGAIAFWAVAPWLLLVTIPAAALLLPVIAISATVLIVRARKKAAGGRA